VDEKPAEDVLRKRTRVDLPPYFEPFTKPHDYKILEGRRGGAKSRSIATWFAKEATLGRHRYLCTREFQTSMKDSVIKLIINAIYQCGLEHLYKINRDGIYCPSTGSEFLFKGIKVDPQSIRSTEGIDRCWAEEAHVISDDSWQVLLPTLFREPIAHSDLRVPRNRRLCKCPSPLPLADPFLEADVWVYRRHYQ
jgi:phage terminase large subunit